MTDDLVMRLPSRLRSHADCYDIDAWMSCDEAADRIEALERELAEERRSREEAQEFAWKFSDALGEIKAMTPDPEFGTPPIENAINVARAALGEKKDD